jgi:hypothetical protein
VHAASSESRKAWVQQRAVAQGGVEGRPQLQRGQMGHQLRRRLPLGPGQGFDASQQIAICQCEDVIKTAHLHDHFISFMGDTPGHSERYLPK